MHRVILEFESSIDKLLWNIPNSHCDEDVDDLKQASKAKSNIWEHPGPWEMVGPKFWGF